MLCSTIMANEPLEQIRQRFRLARLRTTDRETRLSEDEFLSLPPRLQNQLAVLQAQCEEPLDDSREALVATEHNLKSYNAKLQQALDLAAQMDGARLRRERERSRGTSYAVVLLVIIGVLVGGGWLLYGHMQERKVVLCRTSPACAAEGKCTAGIELPLLELVCQAGTDADCRKSQRCAQHGECYYSLGRCAARDNADCSNTPACHQDGACAARDGRCVAVSKADCLPTPGCKKQGKCSPQNGICVVLGDSDCQQSEACQRFGACTEVQSQCVPVRE